jgi:hypothetical protein
MKLKKQHFLAVLLILSTVLSSGAGEFFFQDHDLQQSISRRILPRPGISRPAIRLSSCDQLVVASIYMPGTGPGQTKSGAEKHHHRSIASEAILADFAVPPAQFSYYCRQYSVFQSCGCSGQTLRDYFLRGPPFCC